MVKVTTAGSDAFGGNGERGGGSGVGVCATAVGASAHMCDEAACCGERACPALGCEAPPNQQKAVYLKIAQRLVLGLLRSPTQDKPARHNRPAYRLQLQFAV